MKKLVEEIRKELLRDDCYEHMVDGLNRAIEIIQAHNLWINVEDELPESRDKIKTFSIVVNVTDSMRIRTGYYDYDNNSWCIHGFEGGNFEVIKWSYLPEMKYENIKRLD